MVMQRFRHSAKRLSRRAWHHRIWRMLCTVRGMRHYRSLLPSASVGDGQSFESVKREALAALDELMAVEREPRNRSRLERYSTDHWLRERLFVQQYVQNGLSASFRRSDALGRQITCVAPKSPYVDQYCRYIFSREDFLTERLREGSVESRIGRSYLEYTSGHIVYSTNTIEHLYYLDRLIRNTESRLPTSVVELGGGFGSLARLVQVLSPNTTYVVIDYPEALAVVYLNLRLNFRELPIVFHKSSIDNILPGAVNLVPIWLVEELRFRPDLFLSTFALSETAEELRNLFADRAFLECDRIYLIGSVDNMFKSSAGIQAAVTRLYGKDSIRSTIKRHVYEVIATRR